MSSEWLPFEPEDAAAKAAAAAHPDDEARARAVDPAHHVVLEASAGTGKTHVLVDRYLNLLGSGVDPSNILAITFTRKAASEMRGRILEALKERAARSPEDKRLWTSMRDRSADIAISTIDAFCLSLLREFPLEADLDPGFDLADETQIPRLMEEALDRALDIGRGLARTDEYVHLLFAELREPRIREGLAGMIDHRLVVEGALERALAMSPRDLSVDVISERAIERLRGVMASVTGGLPAFLGNGPVDHPRYRLFANQLNQIADGLVPAQGPARSLLDSLEWHFLNEKREPRQRFSRSYKKEHAKSPAAWKSHMDEIQRTGPAIADALRGFKRDLNAALSRGARRLYRIALEQYQKTLESNNVLDFSETLARAVSLLSRMEEFARSRYRLEARYHHVLVDEFQDTSRAQWALVALLIRSWGEGLGMADAVALESTIFLVGDKKQSIYSFRDADVAVMREAAAFVDQLRPEGGARRAISRSFRAVPGVLAFINDLFSDVEHNPDRADAFEFAQQDRFPLDDAPEPSGSSVLGLIAAPTVTGCADFVAAQIRKMLDAGELVRDPSSREPRPIAPRDIGILFRTRDSHREFEEALERLRIPSYVYKGLGFFESDEIQDVVALLRFLAMPESNLRAAVLMRSRFIRLSDGAIQQLAPDLAGALAAARPPDDTKLDDEDRRALALSRKGIAHWMSLVDRLPPADLLELVLEETAYFYEIRGARARQARENLKKIRSMIRRIQNRGYSTMSRVAEHLERLSAGDDANAVIDAGDAVSLMTVHAAKGLEFPVVFVVNLSRGTGGRRAAIRVTSNGDSNQAWISVGGFRSEADEDAKAREREETKRLLYVAVTRARDRLYLASELKEGRWRNNAGSLGEVLPVTLKAAFEAAAIAPDLERVPWRASSGVTHELAVCATTSAPAAQLPFALEPQDPTLDDFGPLQDSRSVARIPVTAISTPPALRSGSGHLSLAETGASSLTGILVHRAIERFGIGLAGADVRKVMVALMPLLDEQDLVETDAESIAAIAARSYLALCSQPELGEELRRGSPQFEVPFSVRLGGSNEIYRGRFDCLVQDSNGGVVVLELKTGNPVPAHAEQLELYLRAARALFPKGAVEGKLIYARGSDLDHRSLNAHG